MRFTSRALLFAFVGAASAGGIAAIGCMGEGTLLTPVPSDAEAAAPPYTWLRLANLSPTAPNIDFCVAPYDLDGGDAGDGGTFVGPLLAQLASRLGSAGAPVNPTTGSVGLPFAEASAYVPVVALEQYVVRIVAGNAGSCAAPIVTDLPALPAPGPDASVVDDASVATNEFLTIALLGDQFPQPNLQTVAFVDDPDIDAGTSGSKAYLRFIHAAVGQPQLDLFQGVPGAAGAKRLFGAVGYGQVPTSPLLDGGIDSGDEAGPGVAVDRNGYWVTSPISPGTTFGVYLSNQDGGALAQTTQLSVAGGGIVTLALIGDVTVAGFEAGVGTQPYELLVCIDNGATTGLLANCAPAM